MMPKVTYSKCPECVAIGTVYLMNDTYGMHFGKVTERVFNIYIYACYCLTAILGHNDFNLHQRSDACKL